MTDRKPVPAAQYVRMSTEHQQYSLTNQSATVQRYAEAHGFEVIKTYSDAAKSGVSLKHRAGLRQLLEDVVGKTPGFRAILVYDVSRWGRFQDTDESAHYEFVCKSAGVPVHYCAESFANDGTLPSAIMKALKRTMAGEYSRELGVKVLAGQRRLTLLGFKNGGKAGYGLRRFLVSASGIPKQELALGERKSIATDRIILVPGPANEVRTVRDIYRMHIAERRSRSGIARKLNAEGVPRPGCGRWNHYAIAEILTNPKYAGYAVFGRTTSKLHTPIVSLPRSEWIIRPGSFEPLIDSATFALAQNVFAERTFSKTNDELLDDLRRLRASEGGLSTSVIKKAGIARSATYRYRFGSLRSAYKLIGYEDSVRYKNIETRIHTAALRESLIREIVQTFPKEVSVVRAGNRWRKRLRLSSGLVVSVLLVRSERVWDGTQRSVVHIVPRERRFVTLVARVKPNGRCFLDFHIFPFIERRGSFFLTLDWLRQGQRMNGLPDFLAAVKEVQARRRLGR